MITAEGSLAPKSVRVRFAAAVDNGIPVIPRCESCGERFFYPRSRCPKCFSARIGMAKPKEPWVVRSFCWVIRPQSPAFDEHVPILMMVGTNGRVCVIAEGRGWTLSNPPSIGIGVHLVSGPGILGGQVVLYEPERNDA